MWFSQSVHPHGTLQKQGKLVDLRANSTEFLEKKKKRRVQADFLPSWLSFNSSLYFFCSASSASNCAIRPCDNCFPKSWFSWINIRHFAINFLPVTLKTKFQYSAATAFSIAKNPFLIGHNWRRWVCQGWNVYFLLKLNVVLLYQKPRKKGSWIAFSRSDFALVFISNVKDCLKYSVEMKWNVIYTRQCNKEIHVAMFFF